MPCFIHIIRPNICIGIMSANKKNASKSTHRKTVKNASTTHALFVHVMAGCGSVSRVVILLLAFAWGGLDGSIRGTSNSRKIMPRAYYVPTSTDRRWVMSPFSGNEREAWGSEKCSTCWQGRAVSLQSLVNQPLYSWLERNILFNKVLVLFIDDMWKCDTVLFFGYSHEVWCRKVHFPAY